MMPNWAPTSLRSFLDRGADPHAINSLCCLVLVPPLPASSFSSVKWGSLFLLQLSQGLVREVDKDAARYPDQPTHLSPSLKSLARDQNHSGFYTSKGKTGVSSCVILANHPFCWSLTGGLGFRSPQRSSNHIMPCKLCPWRENCSDQANHPAETDAKLSRSQGSKLWLWATHPKSSLI